MCFYIYTPNRSICIEYKSESIFLDRNGTSIVSVDLLINNTEDDPLPYFKIIYPNRLYSIKKDLPVKAIEFEQGKYPDVFFANKSETIIDKNSEMSNLYNELGRAGYHHADVDPKSPWARPWAFSQPNPKDSNNPVKFEGVVDIEKGDTLDFPTGLDHALLLGCLYEANFTVLQYTFRKGVTRSSPRWIRLQFRGENAAKISHYAENLYLRKLTNSLTYRYSICSPYIIMEDFIEKLKFCLEDTTGKEKKAFEELISYFQNDGLIKNQYHLHSGTTYNNISIAVEPRELDIHSIQTNGLEGTNLPEIAISKERYREYYMWTCTDINAFSLYFQAKPVRLPYLILPMIGVSVASISLLTTIFITIFKYLKLIP